MLPILISLYFPRVNHFVPRWYTYSIKSLHYDIQLFKSPRGLSSMTPIYLYMHKKNFEQETHTHSLRSTMMLNGWMEVSKIGSLMLCKTHAGIWIISRKVLKQDITKHNWPLEDSFTHIFGCQICDFVCIGGMQFDIRFSEKCERQLFYIGLISAEKVGIHGNYQIKHLINVVEIYRIKIRVTWSHHKLVYVTLGLWSRL